MISKVTLSPSSKTLLLGQSVRLTAAATPEMEGMDAATAYTWSTSDSSVKMRLTNTRLAFVQGGSELAYFSDNKLYVTRLEAVEQISIGTAVNGFLDIVTTPTGVGFKWRS